MEFSKKLKILAGQHRYSQSMLARELEVSQNLVSLWTRGLSIPDLYEAAKIARLFHVDVNYLCDDALDEPPRSELTEEERLLVLMFRAKGIDLNEAVRRLEAKPALEHSSDDPWVGPQRNMHGRFPREEAERNQPKRVEPRTKAGETPRKNGGRNGGDGQKGSEGRK